MESRGPVRHCARDQCFDAARHPFLVSQLQTEFARSGGYDGRARDRTRAYDHSALGSTALSEAQAETMVNPDGVVDDFWREPMAVIARPATFHRTSLQFPPKLTIPIAAFVNLAALNRRRFVSPGL